MTRTTLTIRRPNGNIEVVDVSDKFLSGMTDGMFAKVAEANKAAGRGEVLSYTVEHDKPSEAELETLRRESDIEDARKTLKAAVENHDAAAAVKARKALLSLEV